MHWSIYPRPKNIQAKCRQWRSAQKAVLLATLLYTEAVIINKVKFSFKRVTKFKTDCVDNWTVTHEAMNVTEVLVLHVHANPVLVPIWVNT
jgi:hypothetical protein